MALISAGGVSSETLSSMPSAARASALMVMDFCWRV